ncbi:MAG: family 3 adenylate cyclase [Fibrobacteres bacterium]|nr:family 3 adenylate cyclase [Fibrobacterota bacterium]
MEENPAFGYSPSRLWKVLSEKFRAGRKVIFNTDYSYLTRFATALGWIGVPAELLFYWYETSNKYWDYLPLRIFLALALASLAMIDWKSKKGWLPNLYWELVLFLVFPLQSTFAMMQNGVVSYYTTGLCLMFFIMGMVTKAWMIPIHLFLGVGGTIFGFVLANGADKKIVADSIGALVNAGFSGIASASIMLLLEGYNRRITEATVALAKAVEEKLKAIEMAKAYEELKIREELIRLYVRPSLVEEIRAGIDPSKAEPVIKNLSIMFCDIREFTKLTETLTPYERQMFLNQYFSMMTRPIVDNGGEVDKIMGDCVMSIFPDGDKAVKAAIAMRLELHRFNETMFAAQSPMVRNGIGIAKGEVMQGNFGSFEKLDRTVIGEAVNIASRLESKTKMYNLEVVVTEDVINDMEPGTKHYRWIDVVQVKGSTRHLKLYEIYGHQPPEVRQYKDDTREILEKALTIYFQKGFKDAARLFRAMLERVPPHTLKTGILMDEILHYYIAHCDAWINNPNGTWEEIQRWDGVHIFTEK